MQAIAGEPQVLWTGETDDATRGGLMVTCGKGYKVLVVAKRVPQTFGYGSKLLILQIDDFQRNITIPVGHLVPQF